MKEGFINKKVTIAIPAKNEGRTIRDTLISLINLDYPMSDIEIIVADNGSSDNTKDIILEFQKEYPNIVRYLDASHCLGGGTTRELLFDNSNGEIFVCTDADIIAHPEWISELVRPFEMDSKIGAVGGEILSKVVDENNLVELYCAQRDLLKVSKRRRIFTEGYIRGFRDQDPSDLVGWYTPFFATANVAYKRSVIEKVGNKWDDNNDDEHFGFKVAAAGYKQYFVARAIVYHMHRNSVKELVKQLYYYGYNHPKLLKQFSKNKFEILLGMDRHEKNYIKVPFLMPAVIFIGWFNSMILSTLVTLLSYSSLINESVFPYSLSLAIISAIVFFYPCFKIKPRKMILFWMYLRLVVNFFYLIGVIKGSFKFRTVCIEEPNY
ncbi:MULTISPECIES: glycosyltransferase [Cytobacillus]|uniref:Glycosyltransferase 2-like domain-containing protein n=1 Tax=Cytobacillus oceanisediminis TaxID=665099 RepID=A0ABX3CKR6_9BACI|nr:MULTISPECIES: glycosyltransferase [Cytobacillus]OHX40706.1 hypothetical protein BBV17_29075 [Cytobacillus oceanisediminis]